MEYSGKKRNYLEENRHRFHNDDYIEFLIQKVWELSRPTRIVDFGCGLGYLGMSLMPYMPEGSSYTGIDISDVLVEQAKDAFIGLPHDTKFMVGNGYAAPFEDASFDMAVCQAGGVPGLSDVSAGSGKGHHGNDPGYRARWPGYGP